MWFYVSKRREIKIDFSTFYKDLRDEAQTIRIHAVLDQAPDSWENKNAISTTLNVGVLQAKTPEVAQIMFEGLLRIKFLTDLLSTEYTSAQKEHWLLKRLWTSAIEMGFLDDLRHTQTRLMRLVYMSEKAVNHRKRIEATLSSLITFVDIHDSWSLRLDH